MNKVLYEMMDQTAIEELVYSELGNPDKLLDPHLTENGLLIQVLISTTVYATVKLIALGKRYPTDMKDGARVFVVLILRRSLVDYTLLVTYDNGITEELKDPYAFSLLFSRSDLKKFEAGIHHDICGKVDTHVVPIEDVKGVYFVVWAPCAMRIGVAGDFNLQDDRRHQMRRMGNSGIFELFIPGLAQEEIYRYEIKAQNGDPMSEADPHGNYAEPRPHTASVVWDINQYQWRDKD